MENYYVYELWNPIKNLPFYVGYCKRKDRPKDHIHEALLVESENKIGANPHKIYTIRQIQQAGLQVEIRFVYESQIKDDAIAEEIRLIKLYGRRDISTGILTNMTDGGEGRGNRVMREAERQKLSERLKGKTYEDLFGYDKATEIKKKISTKRTGLKTGKPSWNRGKDKNNNPSVKKISESLKNRQPWNIGIKMAESVEQYTNPFKGKTHTKEFKERHSQTMKGKLIGDKNPMFGKSANRGKKWYNNGEKEIYLFEDDPKIHDENLVKGRLSSKKGKI